MITPDSVIRKSIAKHFQLRGRACVCLTKREYQRKIDAVLFEIARHGYHRELLDSYNNWILSKIAWIPEDEIQPRRESVIQLKPTKPKTKTGDSLSLLIADVVKKANEQKRKDKIRIQQTWGERMRKLNESLARIEKQELDV